MIPKAIYMDLDKIILLLIFFILYVMVGGAIFMILEAPHEMHMRQDIEKTLSEFKENLKKLNHTNITQEHINTFIQTLLQAQDQNLVDQSGKSTHTQWSFMNSFFFAITVITTIGYGHLSPSTILGRIFCLIYALFGIPMTGIMLGAIGDRFSRCFLDQVTKVRSRYQRQMSARLVMLKQGLFFFVPWFIVFLVVPATVFIYIENWSFIEGFYYSFITLATIGFGDYVAGSTHAGNASWLYKIVIVLWIIFGLAYLSMILNFISQGLRSQHLSNAFHSIRRMSGNPPFSRYNNKNRIHRQRSLPMAYHRSNNNNGKLVISELNLPSISDDSPTTITHSHSDIQPSSNPSPQDDHPLHHFFALKRPKSKAHMKKIKPNKNDSPNLKANDYLHVREMVRRTSSVPDLIGSTNTSFLDGKDSNQKNTCIIKVTPDIKSQEKSNLEKRKAFFEDAV